MDSLMPTTLDRITISLPQNRIIVSQAINPGLNLQNLCFPAFIRGYNNTVANHKNEVYRLIFRNFRRRYNQ